MYVCTYIPVCAHGHPYLHMFIYMFAPSAVTGSLLSICGLKLWVQFPGLTSNACMERVHCQRVWNEGSCL